MRRILGAILIVLGLIGIVWGGFTYTTQKKVVDLGPIQATHTTHHDIPVPPIAGAISIIAGVAFLATSKRA